MSDFSYLDNAATAAPDAAALGEAKAFLDDHFGNPSSLHALGIAAERALRAARRRVAAALGAEERDVVFTAGGTEANNLAIRGVVAARARDGDHIATTAVEHPSVLETCRDLERSGRARVSHVAPRRDGTLDPERVAAEVTDRTVLVSVMHVQNETGALFPVEEIAALAKRRNPKVTVHVDGVQAFGKRRLRLAAGAIDLYAVSGHKLGAPKGVGALWRRPRTRVEPLVTGGGQEGGLRSGTENVFGIVALGAAAAGALADLEGFAARARALGARLRAGLVALGAEIASPDAARQDAVDWILNASFDGAKAEVLLHALEERSVYVSTTAACASRKGKPSHVLEAMGLAPARIETALRFSLGRASTERDVERALDALAEALPRVRAAGRGGARRARARS